MMKPVKLLFVVLGLMVANPLFAADASNYSEDYSQPEEYGAEDNYTENSAADYTATDYTDSEQYNYDQSDDTSDANWEAEAKAYCEELASYEDPSFRETYLQDCLLSQLGQ
ncbi:MAG: hypothetical protein MI808_06555 [Pseudomonadales bacterium]|nr:hypothetical protein [Pseudomonadales bacterium]